MKTAIFTIETIKIAIITLGTLAGFFVIIKGIMKIFKHLINHYKKPEEGHFYEAFKELVKTFLIFLAITLALVLIGFLP